MSASGPVSARVKLGQVLLATAVALLALVATVPALATSDDLVLRRGDVINVTTGVDGVDADTSSLALLVAAPGPDGVSLREAMEVTNRDPGEYTIEFAPHLAGATIDISEPLPPLEADGVIINGDIDGDSEPDVGLRSVAGAVDTFGLTISAGESTIHALELIGWGHGVLLSPTVDRRTYANVTIANLLVRDGGSGVTLMPPGPQIESRRTEHRWEALSVIDNTMEVTYGGIDLNLYFTIGDVVDGLEIRRNHIQLNAGDGRESIGGVHLGTGFWGDSQENQFRSAVIADNVIVGGAPSGIFVSAGEVGASRNTVSGLVITGNTIALAGPGVLPLPILLIVGDGSSAYDDPSHRPIAVSQDNAIRDVEITANNVTWTGSHGIHLAAGFPGADNAVEDVRIASNTLNGTGITPTFSGIYIGSGRSEPVLEPEQWPHRNHVTDVRIEDNTVRMDGSTEPEHGPSGAILVIGAEWRGYEGATTDIELIGNELYGTVPGIHISGGGAESQRNTVSNVLVHCNRIDAEPAILLTGGYGLESMRNQVRDITFDTNLTGRVLDDITVVDDAHGANDNTVATSQVTDAISRDCDIVVPTPPAAPDRPLQSAVGSEETQTAPGPQTIPAPGTRPDSDSEAQPLIWMIAAALAVAATGAWIFWNRNSHSG